MASREEIEARLAELADGLRADGYELRVNDAGATLDLAIFAGEDACSDCLVPPAVLTRVVSAALAGEYPPERISVAYPGGSAAAG